MSSFLTAALVAQMSVSGGAGLGLKQEESRRQAGDTWEDVRKHFSALRNELSTLETDFRAAEQRHRLEAEQQQQRDAARR
jgi:hypothetical protein